MESRKYQTFAVPPKTAGNWLQNAAMSLSYVKKSDLHKKIRKTQVSMIFCDIAWFPVHDNYGGGGGGCFFGKSFILIDTFFFLSQICTCFEECI